MITADAIHTLAQQVQVVTDAGGHYLLTVKTNAKKLYTQISQPGSIIDYTIPGEGTAAFADVGVCDRHRNVPLRLSQRAVSTKQIVLVQTR